MNLLIISRNHCPDLSSTFDHLYTLVILIVMSSQALNTLMISILILILIRSNPTERAVGSVDQPQHGGVRGALRSACHHGQRAVPGGRHGDHHGGDLNASHDV